ncbi:YciI family protein [Nocardiopsis lambiniae]|uniref:YciI family protein n=1 Tax=Nocardiopsis lambiniae TaxID=3075539 RepID=A0ABU2M4J1_9ACTN|nr:YciI family protein [Nocardiopsis sp. DSM 44743]MDT0327571.1 YciI family protein [Nocardiopsis sp. DSM 44743]
MAVYAITYVYAENSDAARDEHRPAHREYLGGLTEQGINLCSGPFGAQDAPGALLLFRADSAEEVLALTEKDPFRLEGVVTDVQVREWIPVLGPLAEHF